MLRMLLPVLAAALALAPPAGAATLSTVEETDTGDPGIGFTAAPGEVNHLDVRPTALDAVRIEDSGAPLTSDSDLCSPVSANAVVCDDLPEGASLTIDLGDGDDSARVPSHRLRVYGPTRIYGSAGADTIRGDDFIDGGSGDDAIEGGPGGDFIEGGAGSDSIDGGGGRDLVAYAGEGTLRIDLRVPQPIFGGERDTLRSVEGVSTEGPGPSVVRGTRGTNTFLMFGGRSVVDARDGDDHVLLDGTGPHRVQLGDGNDVLEAFGGLGSVRCGPGTDTVVDPNAHVAIGHDCERWRMYDDDAEVLLPVRPAGVRVHCLAPLSPGYVDPCRVKLQVLRGGRVVASRNASVRHDGTATIPMGDALERGREVVVRVTLRPRVIDAPTVSERFRATVR